MFLLFGFVWIFFCYCTEYITDCTAICYQSNLINCWKKDAFLFNTKPKKHIKLRKSCNWYECIKQLFSAYCFKNLRLNQSFLTFLPLKYFNVQSITLLENSNYSSFQSESYYSRCFSKHTERWDHFFTTAFNGKVDAAFLLLNVLIYSECRKENISYHYQSQTCFDVLSLWTPLKKIPLYSNKLKEIEWNLKLFLKGRYISFLNISSKFFLYPLWLNQF